MSSLKDVFLLIGPWDPRLSEIGARIVPTLSELPPGEPDYDVIGVATTALLEKKFPQFHREHRRRNPGVQFVGVIPPGYPLPELIRLHRDYDLCKILGSTRLEEAEAPLYEAHETASRQRQQIAVENLLRDQERRLETLRSELESRVEKRTRMLAESRHNMHVRNSRLEGLGRALMVVQEAESLADMERALNESLVGTVEISWIRIVPLPLHEEFAKQIQSMDGFIWLAVPLWRGAEPIGSAFFMRPKDRPFRREDNDFLSKVSEAISLALDRLQKRAEAESLKEQWEATFSAISEPVAIIDKSYEIIQANQENAAGQPCYARFFRRTEPCLGCRRGELFRIENDGRVLEVHSNLLPLEPGREPMYVNLYSDVTDRVRMEERILESAKMAELGTIGSSIAHELNNPLGGILNFAQLLRMDLPADHPLVDDVKQIEAGAQRCKEIVENLLGFTRAPRSDEITEFDLRDSLKRALTIVELRTKSLGLAIDTEWPESPCVVRGHYNLVTQAFAGLLERSLEALLQRRSREPGFRGHLELRLRESAENLSIEIRDDSGASVGAQRPLTLQISSQILRDNGARLEINAPSSPVSSAKISFPRPVLRS